MTKENDPKPTFESYPQWHQAQLGEDLADISLRRWYEINARVAQTTLDQHPLIGLIAADFKKEKLVNTLARHQPPDLKFVEKPYDSLIDKIFRLNCNWNKAFPKKPKDGWVACSDAFERIDDLIRTTIICRYIDGPELVCERLIALAKKVDLEASTLPKATDEGYYAHHVTLKFPFDLLARDNSAKTVTTRAEIQVTTQMQDVLKDLTHKYYKKRRIEAPPLRAVSTRWDFRSEDFRATYLGHTLHLIEGVVAELRETASKNNKKKKPAKIKGVGANAQ